MPRGRGRGGRTLRLSTRTPSTPVVKQVPKDVVSDEEMVDGDGDGDGEDARDDLAPDNDDEGNTPGSANGTGTAATQDGDGDGDAEGATEAEVEASSPPVIQSIPRKRGRGRPPRIPRSDWNTPEPGVDYGSESGTPLRRKRGRPSGAGGWRGGFRGRPKGGPSHSTRVPIDKEGNMMDVVDDEVALPEDAEGETKVDKNGHLQGGRDYRVRVFTLLGRGERLYMLSTEPARCTGFRDSYLFFTKHMQLYKIIIDENEKKDLIDRSLIPHSYKGRAIGVVTARSVFREFGARIVVGGKKVTDDYYAQTARDRGDVEGELADPYDRIPPPGEAYNKNQYVAWHGASQVYHNNQPTVPLQAGKPTGHKRKNHITTVNWQFEHAREASRFNSGLTAMRRANLAGVYDTHTNLIFYPKIMQPTHAKWEQVHPESTVVDDNRATKALTNGNGTHALTNGATTPNHLLTNGTSHSTAPPATTTTSSTPSTFAPPPPLITRNFLITDIYYSTPPLPNAGIPGPDGPVSDLGALGPNGLDTVSQELLDELPQDCRRAFEEARALERGWKEGWECEGRDGARGGLRIGFNGFPV